MRDDNLKNNKPTAITPNKPWKPKVWLAVILAIMLSPFAFLYLHRPALFFGYLILGLVVNIIGWYLELPLILGYTAICSVHAYLIAKKYSEHEYCQWYSRWWGILSVMGAFVLPIFLIRSFLYEPFNIAASSMSPNLEQHDNIIVKKYGYGGYGTYGISLLNTDVSDRIELQRGKVYAFNPPHTDTNTVYVARLIAKPGDTVEVKENQIVINGLPLKTTLLTKNTEFSLYEEVSDGRPYQIKIMQTVMSMPEVNMTVPQNSYFFLGDNRNRSEDSRFWGSVPSNRLVGEMVYVFD